MGAGRDPLLRGPGRLSPAAPSFSTRVRAIRSDGTIYTVAGNGSIGSLGDNGPALDAEFGPPTNNSNLGLALSGDAQYMYIADAGNNRIRRLSLLQPGFANASFAVASQDGSEVYDFDPLGRHLGTLSLPTNAPVVTFGYEFVGSSFRHHRRQRQRHDDQSQPATRRPSSGRTGSRRRSTNGGDGYLEDRHRSGGGQVPDDVPDRRPALDDRVPHRVIGIYSSKTYDSLGPRQRRARMPRGTQITFSRQPDSPTEIQVTKTTGLGRRDQLSRRASG